MRLKLEAELQLAADDQLAAFTSVVFSPAIARWVSEANGPLPLPQTAQAGRDLLKAESDGDGFAGSQQNANK